MKAKIRKKENREDFDEKEHRKRGNPQIRDKKLLYALIYLPAYGISTCILF